MPTAPTYPGVYIEEVPSGVRTITGVSTSVAAFVGYTARGAINKAVQIFDFGSYEREFGPIVTNSEIGYAVQQFFLNGGTQCWVVRIAPGAASAAIVLKDVAGLNVLTLTAASEGGWGNNLRVVADFNTSNPNATCNLTVTEFVSQNGTLVPARSEIHRNLSMDANAPNFVEGVVNAASALVTAARHADVTPAVLTALPAGTSLSGKLNPFPAGLGATARLIEVTVNGDGPFEVPVFGGAAPADLNALVAALQPAIRAANPGPAYFSALTVQRADAVGAPNVAGDYVLITSGAGGQGSSVVIGRAPVNDAAGLLKLGLASGGREADSTAGLRPAASGTTSGDLANVNLAGLNPAHQLQFTVADGATIGSPGVITLGAVPTSLSNLATILQTKLQALGATQAIFAEAQVALEGTRIRIDLPIQQTNATVSVDNAGGGTLADDIKLKSGGDFVNVQTYALGSGVTRGAQGAATPGNDGAPPTSAPPFTGNQAAKTGFFALEDADIFNILSIPLTAELGETAALDIIGKANAYARSKRAIYVVDPPLSATDPTAIQTFMGKLTADNCAAIYYPPVKIPDPVNNSRLRSVAPSGTIAGLYARTDTSRGVWKAPAGTEATLINVQALGYNLTDRENGPLNQKGINCLRQFPVYGRICWGARTLRGADQLSDDYKYVPVRRFALFLEESLYRGTQWVVFEPNDEPLWAQIRLNIGAFLQNLFRQGAFQGKSPKEAYFVKCDSETTTQNDINLGIVNIVVGFAPLKPAEFVIIRVQQMAGQIET